MIFLRYPDRATWAEVVRRPARPIHETIEEVRPIFEAVRAGGDRAVRELTARFDQVQVDELCVPPAEIGSAAAQVSEALKAAIGVAADNIRRFHAAQIEKPGVVETMPGVQCWRRDSPIEPVGLYVPGGSAPLFSTVLMLGIPAVLAGCKRIVMATPPQKEGGIDPAILYAADLVGVTTVYRVGGAQAIAGMALGTETIPRVRKIFGPGNRYVTAAKQLAILEGIAIDMPAGPTEVAIIADESCDPRFTAFDVLAQAEHGEDSHIVLASDNEDYLRAVLRAVEDNLKELPRRAIAEKAIRSSHAVLLPHLDDAIALANEYAPEHLILACRDADQHATAVTSAGSVFVGAMSPEAVGDYASGTNHTLPTDGHARAYSGVSVDSFVKKITFQRLSQDGLARIGPTVETLAEAEGLAGHKLAVSVRLEALH